MKKFDVVILGGGAAGSMCALSAKRGKIAVIRPAGGEQPSAIL